MLEVISTAVVVGKKGQITIPVKVREEHNIQEGDVVRVISNGQGEPITLEVIRVNK